MLEDWYLSYCHVCKRNDILRCNCLGLFIWDQCYRFAQLSIIDALYVDKSDISLPGSFKQKSSLEIFKFILSIKSKLARVFCQLEYVAIQGNNAAIKWFIDGDVQG